MALEGWSRTIRDGWLAEIPEDEEVELIEIGGVRLPQIMIVTHPGQGRRPVELTMRLETRDGVPRCTEVTLRGDEVLRADLRAVPVEDLLEAAFEATPEPAPVDVLNAWFEELAAGTIDEDEVAARFDAWRDEHIGQGRRRVVRRARAQGRRKITDQLLIAVAAIYKANIGRAPVNAIAEHFGVSNRSASSYATRARRAGLLDEIDRGGRAPEGET